MAHPYSATIGYSTNGGSSYTSFDARIMKPPGLSVEMYDDSDLQSPSSTREKAPGMKEVQDMPFTARYTEPLYTALLALVPDPNDAAILFKITFPTLSGQSTPHIQVITGYLQNIDITEMSYDQQSPIEITGVITPSTAFTNTAAT